MYYINFDKNFNYDESLKKYDKIIVIYFRGILGHFERYKQKLKCLNEITLLPLINNLNGLPKPIELENPKIIEFAAPSSKLADMFYLNMTIKYPECEFKNYDVGTDFEFVPVLFYKNFEDYKPTTFIEKKTTGEVGKRQIIELEEKTEYTFNIEHLYQETKEIIFITGPPKSGKTYLARQIQKMWGYLYQSNYGGKSYFEHYFEKGLFKDGLDACYVLDFKEFKNFNLPYRIFRIDYPNVSLNYKTLIFGHYYLTRCQIENNIDRKNSEIIQFSDIGEPVDFVPIEYFKNPEIFYYHRLFSDQMIDKI